MWAIQSMSTVKQVDPCFISSSAGQYEPAVTHMISAEIATTYQFLLGSKRSVVSKLHLRMQCSLFEVFDSCWTVCWDTGGAFRFTNVWSWKQPSAKFFPMTAWMRLGLCVVPRLQDSKLKTSQKDINKTILPICYPTCSTVKTSTITIWLLLC